ncbi:uncharacterized protein C15orf39 homolog isoform 2-T2 [Discoglossus pictus]
MAGKRPPSIQEHMIYSKLSREEVESRSRPDDLFSYKTLQSSFPGSEGHNTSTPWNSATAYMQYAKSALSQHMRSDGDLEKCHRLQSKGSKSQPLQLHESSETQFQVQQHRHLGYPVSPSIYCPTLAVPRPVYRSPVSYMEMAYGTHRLPSLGTHVGSPLHVPPVEWGTPTGFSYVSPPIYGSCLQNTVPLQMSTAEPDRSSQSFSRELQKLSPGHQNREDGSTALLQTHKPRESCTDHSPSALFAQGDVNASRHRSSAFSPPSRRHRTYPSSVAHGSLDSRMMQHPSKSHYSPTRNSYPHQPVPFSCSLDSGLLPSGGKGIVAHFDMEMQSRITHLNEEKPAAQADSELQAGSAQADQDLHLSSAQARRELWMSSAPTDWEQRASSVQTDRDLWMGSAQVGTALHVGSSQVNREPLLNSSQVEREMLINSTPGDRVGSPQVNRKLLVDSSQEHYIQRNSLQTPQVSFFTQSHNSYIMSSAPTESQAIKSLPAKESTTTSQATGLHSTFSTPIECRKTNKTDKSPTSKRMQKSNLKPAPMKPSISSRISSPCQIQGEDPKSSHSKTSPCELLCHSKAESETDRSLSPPMPVINDVFSLAPYRAYLEGIAPHPFTSEKAVAVGRKESIAAQHLLESKQDLEKQSKVHHRLNNTQLCEHHIPSNKRHTSTMNCGDALGTSPSNTLVEEMVLDLSLKKSPATKCLAQDQEISPAQTPASLSAQPTANVAAQTTTSLPSPSTESLATQTLTNVPSQTSLPFQTTNRLPSQSTASLLCQTSTNLPSETTMSWPLNTITSWSPQNIIGCFPQTTMSYQSQTLTSCSSQTPTSSLSQSSKKRGSRTPMSFSSQTPTNSPSQTSTIWTSPTPTSCPSRTPTSGTSRSPTSCPSRTPTSGTSRSPTSCPSRTPTSGTSRSPTSCPSRTPTSGTSRSPTSCPSRTPTSGTSRSPTSCPSRTTTIGCSRTTISCPSKTSTIGTSRASTSCLSQTPTSMTSWTPTNCSSHTTTNLHSPTSTLSSSTYSNLCLAQPIFVCSVQVPPVGPKQIYKHPPPDSHSVCPSQSSAALPLKSPASYPAQFPAWHSESTRGTSERTHSSSNVITPPGGSDNEGNGFHSSKSFLFKKYKIMKLATTEENNSSDAQALSRSFRQPSEAVQSLPPSAPESSPTLGEANVSIATGGEPAQNGSGQHFTELHCSVRMAISRTVADSSPDLLQDWLSRNKEEDKPKSPVKSKSSLRSSEHFLTPPGRDIWMSFDGVGFLLHKLLFKLETFMFIRSCPFPHVIRAGAIFIPIHLVKEILFPELLGPSVDRVLQGHKVELRPTTLSEEKFLRETELKDCPSRMLKLLALKQLPDVYPDLLHLYWNHCVQKQLGSSTQSGLHAHK